MSQFTFLEKYKDRIINYNIYEKPYYSSAHFKINNAFSIFIKCISSNTNTNIKISFQSITINNDEYVNLNHIIINDKDIETFFKQFLELL